MTFQRAAANSIANGSPSRRRQTSMIAAVLSSVRANSREDRPSPLNEQEERFGLDERIDGVLVLATDVNWCPAGGKHTEIGA